MSKFILFALTLPCLVSLVDDADSVKSELKRAREAYELEIKSAQTKADEWFDSEERAARSKGNKSAIDRLAIEREIYRSEGELPKRAPGTLSHRRSAARVDLEKAYQGAIAAYTKLGRDDDAKIVDKELVEFRKDLWKHVDISNAEMKAGYLRLRPNSAITTRKKYSGGFEVVLVAMTEHFNIRLRGHKGSAVIWNWEVDPTQLRVHRPDGNDDLESGSVGSARVLLLKANTWYTVKWRMSPDGIVVTTQGRVVYSERRSFDLDIPTAISLSSERSPLQIKTFNVTPLSTEDK